jgi:ActR/RegA family two-component response regulator
MTDAIRRPLDGTRVLIVEDEYYLADDLSRTLANAGAEVVGPCATLAEAEGKVREGAFEFAVVDMNLRGDFAFAVAQRLGEAGVPFVIATGYNEGSLPEALLHVPRVAKPFAPDEVVKLLAEMRGKPASDR